VALAVRDGVRDLTEFRRNQDDAFYYNWRLTVPVEFQKPFNPPHAAMADLALRKDLPVFDLAANLRRAFSGIVAGNVKEAGIQAIEEHGPYRLTAEPGLMSQLDILLQSFVAQSRMKLPGSHYEPCYVLE